MDQKKKLGHFEQDPMTTEVVNEGQWNVFPYADLVENSDFNVYEIAPAKTWGELLKETIKVFQREYMSGNAQAPHVLSDYVIERVDVHPSPSHLATIMIGS